MTEQEAIKKSIEHCQQMIKWVKGQPKKDKVSSYTMVSNINEDWDGHYCSLCNIYALSCINCPLGKKYGVCGDGDSKNAWGKVRGSETWVEWLIHADKMLEQLKSLRKR